MLGSLTGTITARLNQKILVEVGGIGYWVQTGSWQPEGTVTCYLHHHVREDASDLYGFADIPTLALFEQLISVSGVGPKVALAILSLGDVEKIKRAIVKQDVGFLKLAPGVGLKAAQKIVVDLQNKMDVLPETGDTLSLLDHNEVAMALETLGYKSSEVRAVVKDVPENLESLDAQIKWALQQLSRR